MALDHEAQPSAGTVEQAWPEVAVREVVVGPTSALLFGFGRWCEGCCHG